MKKLPRVLGRVVARELTKEEVDKVSGAFSWLDKSFSYNSNDQCTEDDFWWLDSNTGC